MDKHTSFFVWNTNDDENNNKIFEKYQCNKKIIMSKSFKPSLIFVGKALNLPANLKP